MEFFNNKIMNQENIVCLLNVDRSFKGTLINYSGESNQGCYSGGIMKEKFVQRNPEEIDALLPYLYFLSKNLFKVIFFNY